MPKMELLVTHTHAGAVYQAGHVLDVDDYTAKWLIERGIASLASGGEQTSKSQKKAQAKHSTSNKE